MKTVFIINQYASTPNYGYGGRHYYLAQKLAKKGYRVYLIASASHHLLRQSPVMDSWFLEEKVSDYFSMIWLKMPKYDQAHSKKRVLGWFLFSLRLLKLHKVIPYSPDVLICSSPSLISYLGARQLARKFSVRLVFEVRDIWPLTLIKLGGYKPAHLFIKFLQWIEDLAYRDADAVVSNLKNAIEHMTSRGMNGNKFTWIPNGFSIEEMKQEVALNVSTCHQLPKNKFIIGYTGTLGVANALETLLEAADILRTNTDIAFVLVGDGKEKHALQVTVEDKELVNVHFIDPIPKVEIQSMLSNFDVCYIGWLDNELYQFGIGANKIPEYLYSGKPIIHSYSGGCDPIIEAGAGINTPAGDPQQLAAGIMALYDMPPEKRALMGASGRKVALQEYEYEQLAEALAKVMFIK